MAVKNIGTVNKKLGRVVEKMITRRIPLEDYECAFAATGEQTIKTVMVVEPWE
jgi:hypothetical protein